jgi:hypothetical protein
MTDWRIRRFLSWAADGVARFTPHKCKIFRLLLAAAFCLPVLMLMHMTMADTITTNICIGEIGPGKCYSDPGVSFDCNFAYIFPKNTDEAASQQFCSSKSMKLINFSRIGVIGGGRCGYIFVAVTCLK